MQPRLLLGSTCALILSLSGLAAADDDHSPNVTITTKDGARANMSREQIADMQRALIARNLYQGEADGVWGPKTESAVKNFQTQSGLESTGVLNEPTARALGLDTSSMDRQTVSGTDAPPPAGTVAPAGTVTPSQAKIEDSTTNVKLETLSQDQAREMQQRLQLLGYYRGPVDGKVGEGTRAALQRYFQHQADLARQGVISNATIGMFGTEVSDVPR